MITIKNLSVSIDKKQILKNISFDFKPGKIYALMGPNGSGKSTFALSIMGHPNINYSNESKILIGEPARHTSHLRRDVSGKNIRSLSADKRAKLGIFLFFQTPLALPGVNIFDLLRLAMEKQMDPLTLHKKVKSCASELRIKDDLLKRSLNEDFSGGEKKKLEALQAAILSPRFAIFDEIDTGVDVDALKIIARFLKKHLSRETTLVFITHSTRLLRYIQPDEVIIFKEGKIVKTGRPALSYKIEKDGFDKM